MGFTDEEGDNDEIDRISSNSDESNDDGDDDYNGEEVDDGSLKSQSSDEDRKSQNVDALVSIGKQAQMDIEDPIAAQIHHKLDLRYWEKEKVRLAYRPVHTNTLWTVKLKHSLQKHAFIET
ncbi:uncharacterized protein A4U43_C01F15870 [Asparagus officinalis]|uniref:Uncharacterized protein n=1 Tax=Asparagus officinalis TaxID=4686 RepID=A0A5P1FPX8_ASPOF|nr:uncharacterized protein A4U43_C01F15870 [Asparagus officinalis]